MITVPWVRRLSVDQWITELQSHSYVAALPEHDAADLLNGLRTTAFEGFPDGVMVIPYETWLWVAKPSPVDAAAPYLPDLASGTGLGWLREMRARGASEAAGF